VEDTGPAAAFDGQVVIMFLDAAQVAFERGDRVDRIELAFDETVDNKVMLDRVRKVVGDRGQVELPEERRQHFSKLLAPLHAVLRLASVLALVIAMFLTYNAVSIAVAQRRVQIGIIRALGATRTGVVGLFCFEALLLALPASAVGVLLGRLFASSMLEQTLPTIALAQGYMPLRPPDPELEASTVIEAVMTGTLATLVAAFVPAIRAARVDPAITVRSGALLESMRSMPRRAMVVAGLVLAGLIAASTLVRSMNVGLLAAVAVLAVVVLVTPQVLVLLSSAVTRLAVPVVVRLGVTSISRDLRRSTISVIALASAVTFAVTLGVWIASMKLSVTAWFDRSVTPDLSVTAGSPMNDQYNVPFSDDALDKIQGVPGLEAALPYRTGSQIRGGLNIVLLGTDSRLHTKLREQQGRAWETTDGREFRPERFASERIVALSETASRHMGKKTGDRVDLVTPSGTVEFQVVAVIKGYYLDHPAIFIDRKWLVELWKDARVDSIDIVVAKDADPSKVAEAVRERLGGGQALFVVRAGEVKRQMLQFVDDGFGYARSIEWITLIVALMGVMGTMLAVVLDRRRELGVFRALGATRLQVALAISVEAFALGLAAALLGTACGALQGFVLLNGVVGPNAQWDLQYTVPPLVVLRVGALVTMSTVLAALMPAYRAARIEVTRALTTD
jgi:putative ABC transport system permease protein